MTWMDMFKDVAAAVVLAWMAFAAIVGMVLGWAAGGMAKDKQGTSPAFRKAMSSIAKEGYVRIWETKALNGEPYDVRWFREFGQAMDYLLENMADYADRKFTDDELAEYGFTMTISAIYVNKDDLDEVFGGGTVSL